MDLQLTEHVRNTISLLYKQKYCVKFRYLELFYSKNKNKKIIIKKNQFWPM